MLTQNNSPAHTFHLAKQSNIFLTPQFSFSASFSSAQSSSANASSVLTDTCSYLRLVNPPFLLNNSSSASIIQAHCSQHASQTSTLSPLILNPQLTPTHLANLTFLKSHRLSLTNNARLDRTPATRLLSPAATHHTTLTLSPRSVSHSTSTMFIPSRLHHP